MKVVEAKEKRPLFVWGVRKDEREGGGGREEEKEGRERRKRTYRGAGLPKATLLEAVPPAVAAVPWLLSAPPFSGSEM